jgi:hypothetical protein
MLSLQTSNIRVVEAVSGMSLIDASSVGRRSFSPSKMRSYSTFNVTRMIRTNQGIERILSGPNSSGWSKTALLSALDREPIDAINDAEILQVFWEDG